MKLPVRFVCGCFLAAGIAFSQTAVVVSAYQVRLPAPTVDGNSPGFWSDGLLRVYTSTGFPEAMLGPGVTALSVIDPPILMPGTHYPFWIESVWRDSDGTVYAWYHHEPGGLCGGKLTVPMIGALVSTDGGHEFQDLGIVLSSGDPVNCSAQNGFFAGGHGDFSVILDQKREYFYFLFDNYGGTVDHQGIAIARIAFADRSAPQGKVMKYFGGGWDEPGIGGAVTPIVPVAVAWDHSNTDAFWGPAIHWNTAIERYVVLLNHACCKTDWPQEGIYIMFSPDLSDLSKWTRPTKILDSKDIGFAPGYYPEVFGVGLGETDTFAGQLPRLFIKGISKWQMFFYPPPPSDDDTGGCDAAPNGSDCTKRCDGTECLAHCDGVNGTETAPPNNCL